jgi:hypothetical protein
MGQLTVMSSAKKKTRQRKLFVSGHMSNYHAGKWFKPMLYHTLRIILKSNIKIEEK